MIQYRFTPIAAADLEEIWDFIAEDSVTAADRVIVRVVSGFRDLFALFAVE